MNFQFFVFMVCVTNNTHQWFCLIFKKGIMQQLKEKGGRGKGERGGRVRKYQKEKRKGANEMK